MDSKTRRELERAAELIERADGLLIAAGAGMGVDSGLPDFRGNEGFWKAYPALRQSGESFADIASPVTFTAHPERAWGFYGHRLNLYRSTRPHDGFRLLRQMGEARERGYFVFTSNVDGQFEKAGFDPERLNQCHGSIHHLQCLDDCSGEIWPADGETPVVDTERCLALGELPTCPRCGEVARPNILMFSDWGWNMARQEAQQEKYQRWLAAVKNLVVIECGAGTAIPTVRWESEAVGGQLVRINPNEPESDLEDAIGIRLGAREAISAIAARLEVS
ncbi:SIR2 family NAD-dependent protein deacylase [Microbulbifer yueqingensis]|uniref:protein acetyllysine N-acetyltransferase n=1 Tax=Microbulbifer yueqingensis TaxID=658219 RepID=A0A1G8UC21_9GAMM|nr:Sir2 family NAD-dependent protein deacetylase [Microbulbifer yueqingensis]SDJ51386.1 NAD-dependent protein deacetylase, SIR2 family [Microbulbifer yueqingensis]